MKNVYFPGANNVMLRPGDSTEDQCNTGIIHRGLDRDTGWPVISLCFELEGPEREEFLKTGRVYLRIFGGGMPPVGMTVYNPVEHLWSVNVSPEKECTHPDFIRARQEYEIMSRKSPLPDPENFDEEGTQINH